MTPPQPDSDPLLGYLAGDPDAVEAARPDDPPEAAWDATLQRVRDRLHPPAAPRNWFARPALAGVAAVAAVAAAVWVVFPVPAPQQVTIAEVRPRPPAEPADPLAEFAVLPMAADDEVEFHRMPGDGWFPVGADPLPPVLTLAVVGEVELDDPRPLWPQPAPAPGDAPMIFATKPR